MSIRIKKYIYKVSNEIVTAFQTDTRIIKGTLDGGEKILAEAGDYAIFDSNGYDSYCTPEEFEMYFEEV